MESRLGFENKKFSSIEEEVSFLRSEVLKKEEQLKEKFENPNRESIIREEIRKYGKLSDEILTKDYKTMENVAREIVLELAPEEHDKKIEELLGILESKGIKNALLVLSHFKNPHLEDDFHRFLVQYIKSGIASFDRNGNDRLERALRHTLYEIHIGEDLQKDERKLTEKIFLMQKLYEGIISSFESSKEKNDFFSIEIANSEGHLDVVFYVSVPDSRKFVFEKQIVSVFPRVKIFEKKDDYNIFNYAGVVSGATAKFAVNEIYPIKTYDEFESDPIDTVLNILSNLNVHKEGAAIQIVVAPDYGEYLFSYKDALHKIKEGMPVSKAIDIKHSFLGTFAKTTKDIAKDTLKEIVFGGSNFSPKKEMEKPISSSTEEEQIKKKIDSLLCHCVIRIISSAENKEKSEEILNGIMSSFGQFSSSMGNKFVWKKIAQPYIFEFARNFSFREIKKEDSIPLSIKELATIAHFPSSISISPSLKVSRATTAPPPVDIPKSGITLGVNFDRNLQSEIKMFPEDRLRHMYVIGQTGTGKTTLLKNMIIEDIKNGEGVCFIDPHGSDIEDILANIPPERFDDVVYFNPSHTDRPMALNMLEYDPKFPEQKTFVVNELLSIFNKLFDMKVAGGPMFEQYFRNSVQLVMDDPESGNTLLEVMRVLSSKEFRALKLSKCKNPLVVQFWKEIAEKAGGESSLQNMVPYITNKFDVFLSNDIMRPIVLQEKSSFNMREIMDNKKIFLVNLSKGRLGDINANLIGLILVGKILMAALSRVDSFDKPLPPFYLYIDEFQNITTNSISQILSEARKYKLSLTIAHQFIAQLEESIKNAVFGNVGSIVSFRVGAEDGEVLEKQFAPTFNANDFVNIDNRNCYIKMLAKGRPLRPFSMETLPPKKGKPEIASRLKELSYLTFGKERSIVEHEIMRKYESRSLNVSPNEAPPLS
ncbi:MAG: hypothetical protein QG585_156 [Patescibacteria group bacterium]|nr:hypothetical protein [Patescibacteria group bacterium]